MNIRISKSMGKKIGGSSGIISGSDVEKSFRDQHAFGSLEPVNDRCRCMGVVSRAAPYARTRVLMTLL